MHADQPVPLHDFPDRSIREALSNPGNLRDFLGAAVPDLAPSLDCGRAELVGREFLLEDWRRRESDLLFRVPFRTGQAEESTLVCVLIEHQSSADPRMPLRLLMYAVLYWEREWKAWENSPAPRGPLLLTPILPIVFHAGLAPWRSSRDLGALIRGQKCSARSCQTGGPSSGIWPTRSRTLWRQHLVHGSRPWRWSARVARIRRTSFACSRRYVATWRGWPVSTRFAGRNFSGSPYPGRFVTALVKSGPN